MNKLTVEGTYVRFDSLGIAPGQKTERWSVDTKEDEECLGVVKWFGRWRKYAFFPAPECAFEQICMREISDFLEEQTADNQSPHWSWAHFWFFAFVAVAVAFIKAMP